MGETKPVSSEGQLRRSGGRLTLPQRFGSDDGTILSLSVEKGEGSLDFCQRCFTELLVVFAYQIKPPGVDIQWKEMEWEVVPRKPEVPQP